MRKFCTFLLSLTFTTFLLGQKEISTLALGSSIVKPLNSPIAETPEQARKQLIESLIALKKTLGIETSDKDKVNGSLQEFVDFINATKESIEVRLASLNKGDIKEKGRMIEINGCIRSLNILKSAYCLSEKVSVNYVKQTDLNGQEIIAYNIEELKTNARYGLVEAYCEGYARIKKDQVYGFLNYCGDEVIESQYEVAQPFNNGKALVKKVNWFFIDAIGKESEALFQVVDATPLKYGISIAQFVDNKFALIDNRYDATKVAISEKYDEISPLKGSDLFKTRIGNQWGLITLTGEVKLTTLYESIEHTNMAHIFRVIKNGKIGYMDNEWRIKIEPSFDEVGEVDRNGLAIAKEGSKYRLISFKTYQKSDAYTLINAFGDKKITIFQGDGGLFGLIGSDFKVILTPQYFSIGTFNEWGLAEACKLEKKCGFVNDKGIEVITPVYEELGAFNMHGLVVVRELTKDCNKNKNCKTDIVYNKYGQVIVAKAQENEYNSMKIRYELNDTLHSNKFVVAKMFIDDKPEGFHLIDSKTYRVITPTTYNGITPFDVNGYFRVKKGDVWGLLDTLGTLILQPTYREIKKCMDGYYGVKNEEGKFGFIDKKCKFIIPFEYDDVKFFRKGHCIVSKGKDRWGLINHFNAKIIPPFFKSVVVKDGTYELMDDKGAMYIVDDKGDCQGQNCAKFEEIRKKLNN
jgi:hypothetical protein